jgi:hypothetical protein
VETSSGAQNRIQLSLSEVGQIERSHWTQELHQRSEWKERKAEARITWEKVLEKREPGNKRKTSCLSSKRKCCI